MTRELEGKKGIVIGVANASSIAWGCAKAFHAAGAELAVTYYNAKAEPHVRPLAEQLNAPIILPLDVLNEAQLQDLFDAVEQQWGELDFVLHSIAFAPQEDLHGRVTDCSREGFLHAMDISCYSFIRLAKLAEPLLKKGSLGGSLMTVTYYGSEKVVPNYGIMGPVKSALESAVRYLANELGEQGIRVNAISPGPLMTRAASGIKGFEELLAEAELKSPKHQIVTIDDVGALARFLISDAAHAITGNISFVDAGFHSVL